MDVEIVFNREEEQRLLKEWFETTQFDRESPGIPPILDDDPEEGDETAMDVKVVRHVRTPSGERRFGQPIGSIIVGDGAGSRLNHLRIGSSNDVVTGTDGKGYHLRRQGGKWEAVDAGGDVVASGSSQEDMLKELDKHVGKQPQSSVTDPDSDPDNGRNSIPPRAIRRQLRNASDAQLQQLQQRAQQQSRRGGGGGGGQAQGFWASLLAMIAAEITRRRNTTTTTTGHPSQGTSERKAIRRVRTPAGVRRYSQPIGSIIVRDGLLRNLELSEPTYEGWENVRDRNTGTEYSLGQDDNGKWIATTGDSWEPVISADSESDLYLLLDDHLTPEGQTRPSLARRQQERVRPTNNERASISNDLGGWSNTIQDNYSGTPAYDELQEILEGYGGADLDSGAPYHGDNEYETRAKIRRWVEANPDAEDEVMAAATESIRSLTSNGKLPTRNSIEDDERRGAEIASREKAEADTPRPVKYNEVSSGQWVSVDGGPWIQVRSVAPQSSRSVLINGRDQDGKQRSYYRTGPRNKIVTAANPPPRISQPETQTVASGRSPQEASANLAAQVVERNESNSRWSNLTEVESDYEDWEKYQGADGSTFYVGQQGNRYVATDADSNILGQSRDRNQLMVGMNSVAAVDIPGPRIVEMPTPDSLSPRMRRRAEAMAAEPLNSMTVAELRKLARDEGMSSTTRLTDKQQLIRAITKYREGKAPSDSAAKPGTMALAGRQMTAQEVIDFANNDPASFVDAWARQHISGRTRHDTFHRNNFDTIARNLRDGTWTQQEAARQMREWAKLQTTLAATPYLTAARILDGSAQPRGQSTRNTRSYPMWTERKGHTSAPKAQTGAMIALIPSVADMNRLADEAGEDMNELHVTLQLLGTAADISENAKLKLAGAAGILANNVSIVEVNTFSVSIFNPNSEEPCVVLGVSGEQLAAIHNAVDSMCKSVEDEEAGFTRPDQHKPFVPHITLRYFKDGEKIDMDWVTAQFDKVGPVRFDKVRVAFGGKQIDMPLVGKDTMGDVSVDSEYKAPVITPGGRRGNDRTTGSRANGENWVERTPAGKLPKYIRTVRNGLMREGHDESRATALAVAAIKRWARGGDNVSPKVQAAAVAALAQWEAMKASRGGGKSDATAVVRAEMFLRAKADGTQAGIDYITSRIAEGVREVEAAGGRAGTVRNGRFVRSQAGARRYGKPVGSRITAADRARAGEDPVLSDALKKRLPMEFGQQGPAIKKLQDLLTAAGIETEGDGIFGEKTKAAIKEAQKQLGLKVTGVVDEKTMVALLKASKGSQAKPRKRRRPADD